MAKKFGTTWWSEQWLNALSHIDYNNRLPRGARYARNGAVRSIDINGGKIEARVKGSRPTPYSESIVVEQFEPKKAQAFVERLMAEPLLLASLMHRRLEPAVLDIARECGLKVFPESWKDLGMHCSCPDWAVPCKHLAAVVYKVSEEIDNDPFVVFRLHGLDLLSELKKRGLLTEADTRMLTPEPIERLIDVSTGDDAGEWTSPDVDLSKLPELGDDLMELLTDNPPFSTDGNFKKVYVKHLGAIAKAVARSLAASFEADGKLEVFAPDADISFGIGKDFRTEVRLSAAGEGVSAVSFAEFALRLADVSPKSYINSQPWLETMHRMWLLAANLIVRKDVVPHIVAVGKKYRIVWQPATLNREIRDAVESVGRCVPRIVTFGKKRLANSGEWLLWEMLSAMISAGGRIQNERDSLVDLFFHDEPQPFDGIGQGGTAGGIKAWTDKFFMLRDGASFSLLVEEADDGFYISINISPEGGATLNAGVAYAAFMSEARYKARRMEVMSKLVALVDYMPELRDYIRNRGEEPMKFSCRTFVPVLFKTIPLIRLLGVNVALPKSLKELVKPRVSVKIATTGTPDSKSYIRLDELLTFSWQIALGDTLVEADEFNGLLSRAGELVRFKGRYIYASPDDLEKIGRQLARSEKLSSPELLAIALAESYDDAPVALTEACRKLLDSFRQLPPAPLPEGLNAILRPYQERGYRWMMHNLTLGFGSIIADDMGLGKTLQVIAVLMALQQRGRLGERKALIVVPTGLLSNWQAECGRFAPGLRVATYHGTSRKPDFAGADVVLTSYGVARSDAAKLKKLKWEVIVIDEAQNIKNPAAAQTKAVMSIPATSRIAMSGTPVENRLSEYWSIMNFANKGLLGSLKHFNTVYGKPIQMEGNHRAAQRFKATTAPFMLRRLKSDKSIISDLPDKIERDEYASLTKEQSALYVQTLNEAMREIEGVEGRDHASLFKRQGLVLQMIMALKQICNHPSQFLKTRQTDPELSGKAMLLLDLVGRILDNGEKVLIFTQFKEMGSLIVKMLNNAGIASMFYHGGTPLKKRSEMVEQFQTRRSARVFVLSLKAAGTGLNLTAATNVIHFDLWWNPAVEAQATDRAYRIGQHRNVQVYRFITQGTFEEKINTMIQEKKQLAELTVGTEEKWLASMTDSQLRDLFTLEKPTDDSDDPEI